MEQFLKKKTTSSYPVVGAIGKQSSYVNNNSIVTENQPRFNHFVSDSSMHSRLYTVRSMWPRVFAYSYAAGRRK